MYVKSRGLSVGKPAHNLRRRETRFVSTVPVELTRFLRFGPSATRGMSLDVSRSGMSVLVCGAPRVGETVMIAPRLTTEPVEILATVRHSTNARSGFEFYPLSPVAKKTIEDWIEEQEQEEAMLVHVWRCTEN